MVNIPLVQQSNEMVNIPIVQQSKVNIPLYSNTIG